MPPSPDDGAATGAGEAVPPRISTAPAASSETSASMSRLVKTFCASVPWKVPAMLMAVKMEMMMAAWMAAPCAPRGSSDWA